MKIRDAGERKRKASSAPQRVNARKRLIAAQKASYCLGLRRLHAVAWNDDLADRGRKIVHAGARNNDRVATAVSFFGDTQKLPAIVFAELHMEDLAFDLHVPRLDNAIHFRSAQSRPRALEKGRQFCVEFGRA
jgi:hypothetical protein